MAHQPGHAAGRLARGRHADDQVVLPGQAVQGGSKAAEQRGEEAGTGPGTDLAHLGHQGRVEQMVDTPGVEGTNRRSRPVGRQVQHGQGAAGKTAEPEALVFGHRRCRGFSRFPGHVVGIGRGRRGAGRGAELFGIEGTQVFGDEAPGPAVANDVVGRHQQQVLVVSQAVERRAKQRALLQIERRLDRLRGGLGQRGLAL